MSTSDDIISAKSQSATSNADEIHIRDALHVLLKAGNVVELRVPGTQQGTVSGYFDDFRRLASTACRYSGTAPGVYITLNPVDAALLARAKNHTVTYAKHTTGDAHIVRRSWILVDLDPIRPAGISSTDEEHQSALDRALISEILSSRTLVTELRLFISKPRKTTPKRIA